MKITLKNKISNWLSLPLILIFSGSMLFGFRAGGQTTKPELPAEKQTKLALYVTSAEAYAKWKANPEKIKILDVRLPEEYIYVGHFQWHGIFRFCCRLLPGMLKKSILA